MTAKQFSRALTLLGLTQVGFAKTIQADPTTVRNWIGGRRPVPTAVAMLVNLMLDTGTSVDQLKG